MPLQIPDYEQVDLGGGMPAINVRQPSGKMMMLTGDAAVRVAQQIDAARALSPAATAMQPGTPQPSVRTDVPAEVPGASGAMVRDRSGALKPVVPPRAAGGEAGEGVARANTPEQYDAQQRAAATHAAAAPASEGEAPAAERPPTLIQTQFTVGGQNVYWDPVSGNHMQWREASAGSPAHWEPVSQSISGRTPISPETREALSGASIDAKLANQAGYDAGQQNIAIDLEAMKARQEAIEKQNRAQNAIVDRAQQEYEAKKELRDKTVRAYASATVDPDRTNRGWAKALNAIGMALGAAGSALAHVPNFAQQLVQGRIDADIRAQEKEIEIKGQHADNALRDLQRQGMDLGEAKKTLELGMTAGAANMMGMRAKMTQSNDLRAAFLQNEAQLNQKRAELSLELDKLQQGQLSEQIRYVHATAPSAGGLVGIPAEKIAAIQKAEGGGAGGRALSQFGQKSVVGGHLLMHAVDNGIAALGGKINAHGKVVLPTGAGLRMNPFNPQNAKFAVNASIIAHEFATIQNQGGVPTPEDVQRARAYLESLNPAKAAATLETIRDFARQRVNLAEQYAVNGAAPEPEAAEGDHE